MANHFSKSQPRLVYAAEGQVEALEAEIERLKHDLDRYMTIATNEVNESERLRAALKDMLLFFGKPKRDEWMNEPAWREACQVCENASKMLNEQITK